MELHDKTALITGGGSGIGAATAKRLAAHGVRVMIAGRRLETLETVVTALRASGQEAHCYSCDVRSGEQCARLVDATTTVLGGIDILVNNAGVSAHSKRLDTYTENDWYDVIDTNLKSAFLLSGAVLPQMTSRSGGFIVMVSSISGVRYYAGETLYGLSKHGMNVLAEYIMTEYGEQNIHSVAICPGLVRTNMGHDLSPIHDDVLLAPENVAAWIEFALRQPDTMRIRSPIVLSTTRDPWSGQYRS